MSRLSLMIMAAAASLFGAAQQPSMRMVIANGALCRETPDISSEAISRRQIGEIMAVVASVDSAGQAWFQFEPHLRRCWIHGSLVADASHSHAALLAAADRILARGDTAKLEDLVAVDNLLRRTRIRAHNDSTVLDTSPLLQLRRLQILDRAGSAERPAAVSRDPLKLAWFLGYRDTLRHDEPGGRWVITAERFWDLYERHASSQWAEEIAWVAAQGKTPGDECDALCAVDSLRRTYLRYLTLFPQGQRANAALQSAERVAEAAEQAGCLRRLAPAAVRERLAGVRAGLVPLGDIARERIERHIAVIERICSG